MHDPMTVAFDIKSPFKRGRHRSSLATIWHVDPEKDGTDDSCGWFKRARHGDPKTLERIVRRFESDWDNTFEKYDRGLFRPNGEPNFSVPGVVLNLFFMAASEYFESNGHSNWKKARGWMKANLFDILHFGENPTDSISDSIRRVFEIGCGEAYSKRKRDERLRSLAGCIYGYILRAEQPWYRHARWHVWHWKIQIHPLQKFKRWAFSRCCRCGKGFSWGYCPVSDSWDSDGPSWFRSEPGVYHSDCSRPADSCQSQVIEAAAGQ